MIEFGWTFGWRMESGKRGRMLINGRGMIGTLPGPLPGTFPGFLPGTIIGCSWPRPPFPERGWLAIGWREGIPHCSSALASLGRTNLHLCGLIESFSILHVIIPDIKVSLSGSVSVRPFLHNDGTTMTGQSDVGSPRCILEFMTHEDRTSQSKNRFPFGSTLEQPCHFRMERAYSPMILRFFTNTNLSAIRHRSTILALS